VSDTVWKYTLGKAINDLAIPDGGQILTVAEQHGQVTMWVRVNRDAYVLPRTFYVVGTGTDIPDAPTVYRGTVITAQGSLVFHVFEGGPAVAQGVVEGGHQ
jgi:hypothetical protein